MNKLFLKHIVSRSKIKRAAICLFLTCFLCNAKGQDVDSLLNKLRTSKEDTNKVKLLNSIAYSYIDKNPAAGIKYGQEAIKLSQKIKFVRHGAISYCYVGKLYSMLGDFKQAEEYFIKSEKLFKELNNTSGLAFVLGERSTICIHREQYPQALELRLQALKIYEQRKDLHNESEIYSGIAFLFSKMYRYNEALIYFNKAIAIKEKLGEVEKAGLSVVYLNMGSMFYDKKDWLSASECFEKTQMLQKDLGDSLIIVTSKMNLADIYRFTGRYDLALTETKQCFEIFKKLEDTTSMALALNNMGTTYNEMKKWGDAISTFSQVIKLSAHFEDKEPLKISYEGLSNAYKGKKNFEQALKYNELFYTLDTAVYNANAANKISQLKEQYEAEKRDQEILVLKQKDTVDNSLAEKRELQAIIALMSSLLLFSILLLFVIRNRSRRKQQALELEKNRAVFEQQALRAQMNPHFIFNALNSIQHYILNNETQYAYDYLAKFSKLIRQVLSNSQKNDIRLTDELELLKIYIELEHRRFEDRFDYKINCPEEIPVNEIKIPVMLIQPFVENAVWHGIMNLDKGIKGLVSVSFELNDNQLKITIEDNGVGREAAAKLKGNNNNESIGMLFTQKRLELLKTISKEEAKIEVTDLKDETGKATGTKVEILITVNN